MLLSIIIPLYNKANTIKATINSVLSQDFQDYEIIVVDDGSTDDGVNIVQNIDSDKIKIFLKRNGGPSSARNFGVRKAQGDWVLLLDADDKLTKDALKLFEWHISKKKRIDVFTFNFYLENKGQITLSKPSHANGLIRFPFVSLYLDKIFPRTGSMVCRKKVYIEEPFNEGLYRYEDAENNFRLMEKFRFYASSQPVMVYNQDTLAASHGRENVEEDFCCVMQPKGKPIFQQMLMYRLYNNDTCRTYPELAPRLYQGDFDIKRIERWNKRLEAYKQLKRKVRQLLFKWRLLS